MKKLYKKFPRKLKPKWLTLKDIREYEKKMTKKTPYISKRKILNKKVLKRRKREEGFKPLVMYEGKRLNLIIRKDY